MSTAATMIKNLAAAVMNLDDAELTAIERYGSMPQLSSAAEYSWWLRTLVLRERQRRAGEMVHFPEPLFDFWTAGECADNLVAAVQVADGTSDRLQDVAMAMVSIIALIAAVRLKEREVIHSN